jgi:hypothetical protein
LEAAVSLIRIDHHPSRRQLLVFAVLWLVFFGILGKVVLSRTGCLPAAWAIWGLAALVPAAGCVVPEVLRLAYVGMMYVSFPIGFVVSFLILAAVYYLAVTPIGLAMRLFGYDPMCRRFDPKAETYWSPRPTERQPESYFRQF